VREGRIELADGRSAGYADYGGDGATAALWCHGGPGSRLEPATLAEAAAGLGVRIVGIDRPGYGLSTPNPGRSIADWVPDALAIADHLALPRFALIGVSTGGAYALAVAALAPARVLGVLACCALTDMRWSEGKALMKGEGVLDLWAARDREAALAAAENVFGGDGSKLLTTAASPDLAPADQALLADPAFLAGMAASFPAMFAHGVEGYADDRLADGVGWGSFDVSHITCPVTVLHGASDSIVPVAHARHTARIVPGARLRICEGLGHFSIFAEVLPELARLVRR
jgi:pimeloyl-ACP methyl ester carboxylesterase